MNMQFENAPESSHYPKYLVDYLTPEVADIFSWGNAVKVSVSELGFIVIDLGSIINMTLFFSQSQNHTLLSVDFFIN